jgi:hypothetical protein
MSPAPKYVSKDYVIQGSLARLTTPEEIWDALDKRVRTSVRKGEKMGVNIRPFDPAQDLPRVIPFTPNDDDIPAVFEPRHEGWVAEDAVTGDVLGWILLAGIGRKRFMLCHASSPAGKERQTPNLLLWHALKVSCGKGYGYFDIGGSYRPSLQKYFSGFRQEAYPLVMRPTELPMDLRITPFDTAAYGVAPGDPERGRVRLTEQFGTPAWTFFPRARFAIAACLREWKDQGRLSDASEVWIVPTTDTAYVSSCVTQAIESVCAWSMEASEKTGAVFLIHEFGLPNPRAAELRAFCDARGIPLIEDLAYGWGSDGTGTWGDVKIVSLTKLLPVQYGGALIGMEIPFERMWQVHGSSDKAKEEEILGLVDAFGLDLGTIRAERQRVWGWYADALKSVLDPFVALPSGVLPGAFLVKVKDEDEMRRVSAFVKRFGVEVGNWYHHAALFLPCHQRMTKRHVEYVSGAILANYRENCGIPH